MCGQMAYDWNTTPRLRRSAGWSIPARRSTKVSLPLAIRPWSGVWRPAMHISVVVLPQPEGPSRVTNSFSPTLKLTPSSTLVPPNDMLRFSTVISGTARPPQDPRAEQQHDGDDHDLDDGQRGDRSDDAPGPVLEHRHAEHLGAGLLQEDHRVVVAEQGDEHQHECGQQRGPQDRQQDPPGDRPPPGSAGARGVVKFGADPGQAWVEHPLGHPEVPDAHTDRPPPPVVAHQRARGEYPVGPEEPDAEDDARHGPRIDHGRREGA